MLKKVSYPVLIIFALFLGFAPFSPEPHLVQKLKMLSEGTLRRPVDVFDLFFHSIPLILLLIKSFSDIREYRKKSHS